MQRSRTTSNASRGKAEVRLLRAVTELGGRDGYVELTVERVLEAAGASRASFYQYFSSVDDCFWTGYRLHADELIRGLADAVASDDEPELVLPRVLVETAIQRPDVARLLISECLAAGPVGLLQRDALIGRIREVLAPRGELPTVDLPTTLFIGAVFRLLAIRLAEKTVTKALVKEVADWACSFEREPSRGSWGAGSDVGSERRSVPRLSARLRRQGSVRERILRAVVAAVHEKGYRSATVADFVATAGVSRRHFYNEFSSKAAAVIAAYELGFTRAVAECAPAFLGAGEWPERVWASAFALARFFSREPSIAYLGLVECHALGRDFEHRVHETHLAFTLFLEEGYHRLPETSPLRRHLSVLTMCAVSEAGFQASRGTPSLHLRTTLPMAAYIVLTPFIGIEQAVAFVSLKLRGNFLARPPAAPPSQPRLGRRRARGS